VNVLVAVASRHGSTTTTAISAELRAAGLNASVRDIDSGVSPAGYDAVVLGSAVYMGGWLPEMQRYIERHAEPLGRIPVWLFSSGPLGREDPRPPGDPKDLPRAVEITHARDHRIFVGRLDPAALGFAERLLARAVHAPAGDFRDWEHIRAWAREIAATLTAGPG
jgi:menaquinone-dependent protoporphyrinogen oxidase